MTSKRACSSVEDDHARVALVTCDLLAMTATSPIRSAGRGRRDRRDRRRTRCSRPARTSTRARARSPAPTRSAGRFRPGTESRSWPAPATPRRAAVPRSLPSTLGSSGRALLDGDVGGEPARASELTSEAAVLGARSRRRHRQLRHPSDGDGSVESRGLDRLGRSVPSHGRDGEPVYPTVFLQGCQGDVNPSVTSWDDGDPAAWAPVVDAYADRLATTW